MGKTRKISVLVLVLFCLSALLLATGCSRTAAVVNGERITYKQLDQQLEKRFGEQFLEMLIIKKLIEQKAKQEKITVAPEEIKVKIDEFKTRPNFELMLRMQNITIKDLENELKTKLLLNKIISKEITEDQLKDFYNKNKKRLEQIKASHILVNTKSEADAILTRLKKGEDFSKIAKEKSIDPGSKEKGGDLGYFSRQEMNPKFSEVAFELKVGEVSQPVKTRFGWHIIKVEDKKNAYNQLSDRIKIAIVTPDKEDKVIQKLKKEAKVKNYLKKKEAPPKKSEKQ